MTLNGKVVFVTGASRGIGAVTARSLLEAAASVVGTRRAYVANQTLPVQAALPAVGAALCLPVAALSGTASNKWRCQGQMQYEGLDPMTHATPPVPLGDQVTTPPGNFRANRESDYSEKPLEAVSAGISTVNRQSGAARSTFAGRFGGSTLTDTVPLGEITVSWTSSSSIKMGNSLCWRGKC